MATKTMTMLDRAATLQKEIVELRRYLHANPELSFQEFETSKLAAEKLKDLGFGVKTGVGKTGVIAEIGSGRKTIGIRADMDGLPVLESNATAFCSTNKGVMHACGHDAHVSCAIAAAKLLAGGELDGRIRMLMQPAEENVDDEGKSGALRMMEDGAMEGVDAIIGLHMDASLPAGKVSIQPGPVMAACDIFKIVIQGRGGHGAYPELTIDAVVLAANVIQALNQIVSRRIAAVEPAVVTIGSVHSSSVRGNVISDSVELWGTMRTFSEVTRQKVKDEIELACSIARVLGGDYRVEYEDPGYPVTVNEPGVTAVMRQVACELIGDENVLTVPPKTWSEDFSVLAHAAPGAFMFLGGAISGSPRTHHAPSFDIDESGLHLGTAILAETAKRLLQA